MPARDPAPPHQKQKPGKKFGAKKRDRAAKRPKVPLPPVSFGHGVNTNKFATEGEVKGARY